MNVQFQICFRACMLLYNFRVFLKQRLLMMTVLRALKKWCHWWLCLLCVPKLILNRSLLCETIILANILPLINRLTATPSNGLKNVIISSIFNRLLVILGFTSFHIHLTVFDLNWNTVIRFVIKQIIACAKGIGTHEMLIQKSSL